MHEQATVKHVKLLNHVLDEANMVCVAFFSVTGLHDIV